MAVDLHRPPVQEGRTKVSRIRLGQPAEFDFDPHETRNTIRVERLRQRRETRH
jgi:hypothetical protein